MTRKIFLSTLLVGLTVLLLCALVFFGLQYSQTRDETLAALRREAVYAAQGIALSGEEYLETLEHDHRITWIARDGSILFDSDDAHADRSQAEKPEVAASGFSIPFLARGINPQVRCQCHLYRAIC